MGPEVDRARTAGGRGRPECFQPTDSFHILAVLFSFPFSLLARGARRKTSSQYSHSRVPAAAAVVVPSLPTTGQKRPFRRQVCLPAASFWVLGAVVLPRFLPNPHPLHTGWSREQKTFTCLLLLRSRAVVLLLFVAARRLVVHLRPRDSATGQSPTKPSAYSVT